MKLSPKGFTLVELMIVIAIIGILAAALFPSLTSYLARGRDTSRTAGIKEISTAYAAYGVDKNGFPDIVIVNCVNSGTVITTNYLPKFPIDPTSTKTHGSCGQQGLYGYGTGNTTGGTPSIALSAQFESANGGNTGTVTTFQGDVTSAEFTEIDAMKKGAAGSSSGYVVRN